MAAGAAAGHTANLVAAGQVGQEHFGPEMEGLGGRVPRVAGAEAAARRHQHSLNLKGGMAKGESVDGHGHAI